MRRFLTLVLVTGFLTCTGQNYFVYVACESEDEVAVVRFDGKSGSLEKTIQVGYQPTENEGPHGVTVDPSGEYWYLTMAHGNPNGRLYKYRTDDNSLVGFVELGIFPATMQVSNASGMLFCVNFNLHGRMTPSTVSVVDPVGLSEITRITTGSMPHGSRISPDGLKHYSVAMMSGELFEIDVLGMKVSRTLNLDNPEPSMNQMDHGMMDHSKMDHSMHEGMQHSKIKPTWVIPHPDGTRVFVAGNGARTILEVNLSSWSITQRYQTGNGPYNVEISPDGQLMVATYKSDGATGIWDLDSGKELGVVSNSRRVSHGIAISPDSRYAFVSVEGIGGEPGSVDIIDLSTQELAGVVEVGKQAGGIAFWKMEN